MRSLSNIIKSGQTSSFDNQVKTIDLSNTIFETNSDYDVPSAAAAPILKKAEADAADIRKKARDDAECAHREIEEKRKKAEKEIQEELTQAKEQGQREGYQVGLEEGRKQYQERINEARGTVDSAKEAHKERLDETEYDILELGIRIAGKIVRTKLAEEENQWLDVVKDVITEVKEYEEIRLTVHHKWYDFVVGHQRELESLLRKSAELYIYPEASDDEFSCIIEYPYGRIDAGVDSRLSEIKHKLAAKMEESTNERADLTSGN